MAVPKLRFPEFTDDWEQRKLGEVATIERGGSPRPIDAYITDASDGLNWVKIGDAPEQGRYINHTEEKIKPSGLSKTRQVFPGDLILSNSMSFGKPYIMGIPGCIHDGWLLIRNSQNVFDLKFLCHMLGTDQMLKQYQSLAAGSTVNNLNKELVSNAVVSVPNKPEQERIGAFLESIDDVITLHQRKLDDIKLLKKSMLQKMFPAEGRDVPEVRFPGFTAAWEQRKLFEMATFSKGSGYSKADLAPSGTPIILYGRMYTKYETIIKEVDTFAEEKAGSVYSKGGEVIVPASGETAEDISRASVVENTGVLLGGDINIIHPNDNLIPGFLALTISNGNQQKKLSAKAQGASIVHLHNEDLKDVDILYPTIAEQRKISEFFQGLDDTITLHQRKCDDLQKLKKALLQQMFC